MGDAGKTRERLEVLARSRRSSKSVEFAHHGECSLRVAGMDRLVRVSAPSRQESAWRVAVHGQQGQTRLNTMQEVVDWLRELVQTS